MGYVTVRIPSSTMLAEKDDHHGKPHQISTKGCQSIVRLWGQGGTGSGLFVDHLTGAAVSRSFTMLSSHDVPIKVVRVGQNRPEGPLRMNHINYPRNSRCRNRVPKGEALRTQSR